jgi:restriction system protein
MARRKSFLERMLGGESQQAKEQRERENRNVAAHVRRQAQRRADLDRQRAEREQATQDQERARVRQAADLQEQNEGLQFHLRRLTDVLRHRERGLATTPDLLAAAFRHGGPDAFARAVEDDLSNSPYPPGLPTRTSVLAYRPDAGELIIERELPRDSVIPPEQEYRIFKGRILPVPRKAAEVRHLYGQLLARIALRTVAEAFTSTSPGMVNSLVLNGRVTSVDRATGRPVHPHLMSVQFGRAAFEELDLDAAELDPELCLRRNDALISPHPYDLVPVTPLPHHHDERYRSIAG